jgi:ATP synthase protein I
MLKKVSIYDAVILAASLIVCMLAFKAYTFVIIIGILLALANFNLNAVVTNYTFIATGKRGLLILATVIRVIVTAVIAVLLCKNNMNNLIAFLIGYSLHYIAIVVYGTTRGTQKTKKEVIK